MTTLFQPSSSSDWLLETNAGGSASASSDDITIATTNTASSIGRAKAVSAGVGIDFTDFELTFTFTAVGGVEVGGGGTGTTDRIMGIRMVDAWTSATVITSASGIELALPFSTTTLRWRDTILGITNSQTFTIVSGSLYHAKIRAIGATLYARIWLDGDTEPTTWLTYTTQTGSTAATGKLKFAIRRSASGSAVRNLGVNDILVSSYTESAYATGAIQGTVAAGTGTYNVSRPTDAADGDIMILTLARRNGATIPTISGWTAITSRINGAASGSVASYWRQIQGGDTTFSVVETTTGAKNWYCIAYAGLDTTNPIDTSATAEASGATTSWVSPSVTTTVNNAPIVRMTTGLANTVTAVLPDPSDIFRVLTNATCTHAQVDNFKATAGATGTETFTGASSSTWMMQTIALKPSAGDVTVSASSIAAIAALPTPDVPQSFTASVISAVAAVNAPTVNVFTGPVASVIAAISTVPATAFVAGSVVPASVIARAATVPAPTVVAAASAPRTIDSFSEASAVAARGGGVGTDVQIYGANSGLQVGEYTDGASYWGVDMSLIEFDTTSASDTSAIMTLTANGAQTLDWDFSIYVLAFDFGGDLDETDWRTPVQLQALDIVTTIPFATFSGLTDGQQIQVPVSDLNVGGMTRYILCSLYQFSGSDTPTGSSSVNFDTSVTGTAPFLTFVQGPRTVESFSSVSQSAARLGDELSVFPAVDGLQCGDYRSASPFWGSTISVMEFNTADAPSTTATLTMTLKGSQPRDWAFDIYVLTYDFGDSIEGADWRTPTQLQALPVITTIPYSVFQSLTAGQQFNVELTDGINAGGMTRIVFASSYQYSNTNVSVGNSYLVCDADGDEVPFLTFAEDATDNLRLAPSSFIPIA